jgi:hypothetical protein
VGVWMRCAGTSSRPAPLPARGCTRVSTGCPATSPTRSRVPTLRSTLLPAACCCRGSSATSPRTKNRSRAELAPSRAQPGNEGGDTVLPAHPSSLFHLSRMRVAPPFVRPYSAAAMPGLDARCIIAHGACRASTPTQVLKRPSSEPLDGALRTIRSITSSLLGLSHLQHRKGVRAFDSLVSDSHSH